MHVVHVVQSLDPAWGGIARVLPELAAGLTSHGVESTLLTLSGGRYGKPPTVEGVDVVSFPARQGRLGRSAAFAGTVGSFVQKADVVHLHGLWTHQNWCAGVAARKHGKPLVMTPHSMMMPWAWQKSWWKKRPIGWLFEHRNLRSARLLHALAEGEAAEIRKLGLNERVQVIPNGIWPEEFEIAPPADGIIARHPELADRQWLLFLSRIVPQKGVVPMMQACLDAAAVSDGWQLVLAGPDEVGLMPMLMAAANRKQLANRVTYVGMLDRTETRAALGRASLLLQPSLSEGLSMSILEGLAAGVPVVVSPACNMPEVAAAGAGRVVEAERRPLAAALRELLALGADGRREMGNKGRSLVRQHFSWNVLLPRYVAMYNHAAAS